MTRLLVLTVCAVMACSTGRDTSDDDAPVPTRQNGDGQAMTGKRSHSPADELVRLTLLADTTRVGPGQTFTLAARYDIEPGWHLYWLNPGEAGLPTKARFIVPDGFEVGEVHYPGPLSFDSPGEIKSYGYDDYVILSAEVTAPNSLGAGKDDRSGVRLSVDGSWLACRDVCIRGKGTAAIDLPVADASVPAEPAHAELFARHRESLPRPVAELDGASHSWTSDPNSTRLSFIVPGAERLAYFPHPDEDLRLTGQASIPGPEQTTLELSFKSGSPRQAAGVLAVTRKGTVSYYQLALDEGAP